jgi:hypothetical protein
LINRNKILTYAVPALLVGIATTQLFLATFSTLSPWKGGGFGMFSSISQRAMSCEVRTEDGQVRECQVPFRGRGEYGPLTRSRWNSLKLFPTKSKLQSILEDMIKGGVRLRYYALDPDQENGEAIKITNESPIKGMRLRMYELVFDQATMKAQMRPIPGLEVSDGWGTP